MLVLNTVPLKASLFESVPSPQVHTQKTLDTDTCGRGTTHKEARFSMLFAQIPNLQGFYNL